MKLYDFEKLERDGYYKIGDAVYFHDALAVIRDNAFSPVDDDEIWVDNRTTLGGFVDGVIQRIQ